MQFWGGILIVINGWETHLALEYDKKKRSCLTFFSTTPVG